MDFDGFSVGFSVSGSSQRVELGPVIRTCIQFEKYAFWMYFVNLNHLYALKRGIS